MTQSGHWAHLLTKPPLTGTSLLPHLTLRVSDPQDGLMAVNQESHGAFSVYPMGKIETAAASAVEQLMASVHQSDRYHTILYIM